MQIKYLKKIKIPDKPGVYFFKKSKDILYIGRATSLSDRIKSYFGKDLINTRGLILVGMVFKADKIFWQTTDSVLEALILEANLIKKHQPKYNTKEKSDKSFNYVCITKPARNAFSIPASNASRSNAGWADAGGEKLPKVIIVRGKNLKPQLFYKFFGPYTNGSQLREAVKIVRKIFPFLDDKSKNYLEFYKQINLAPDLNDLKLYKQNIKNIVLFFSGKKQQIFRNLKKEMNVYAKKREFEKAGEIKRQLFTLQHINDVALLKNESYTSSNFLSLRPSQSTGRDPREQKIQRSSASRIEAYDIAHMSGKNMAGVMVVVEGGVAIKSGYKRFKIRTQKNTNDTGALKEVLERRLVHQEWTYPDLIVVDGGKAQINVTQAILKHKRVKIPIVSVLKDERHKPKNIMGNKEFALKYKQAILLANSEAHRFAINYHKNMRAKTFLR